MEKLLREGRKFGLGLMLASQQPEDFSSVAFANTATKVVFQVGDDKGAIARQHRTLSCMGRETNQGEIGVVIDGIYYGITEYLEE